MDVEAVAPWGLISDQKVFTRRTISYQKVGGGNVGLFDRMKGTSQTPVKTVVAGSTHGSHWDCIVDSDRLIKQKMAESTQNGLKWGLTHWKGFNIEHQKDLDNDTFGLMSSDPDLRLVSVYTNKSLWSAYPVPAAFSTYPAQVKQIHQWKNLVEGWLSVEVCGMGLNLFDAGFFGHMGNINMKNIVNFSAIAYSIKKIEPSTIDASGKRFWGETSIFLPHKDGAVDDYDLLMPVTSVKQIDIWGKTGYQFIGPLSPAVGPTPPFVVPVMASQKVIQGPIPQRGDYLSGVIWLQGFIKKE